MPIPRPYEPDDAGLTVEALRYLLTPAGADLCQAARAADAREVRGVAALRRAHPPDAVHAALTVAGVQAKALRKYPAPWFWSPPEALEQASSLAIARHKARRFSAWPGLRSVVDLCAGVGGDALGLAECTPVLAVELSAVRAWCARQNAVGHATPSSVEVVCSDVTTRAIGGGPGVAFHIDPARRSAGKRSSAFEDLIPGAATLTRCMEAFSAGAIKLSPGVAFDGLPPGHLEIISEDARVTQAVLWTGALAQIHGGPGKRSASVLRHGAAVATVTAAPRECDDAAPPAKFIYEVDPAIHRAELAPALTAQVGGRPLSADGGYLSCMDAVVHPALAEFYHLSTFAYSEKRVAAALRNATPGCALAGPIEVKTRGGLRVDTDALQIRWSRIMGQAVTVLIYRGAGGTQATLAVRRDHRAV